MPTIQIENFEPLTVTFPDEPLTGSIQINLPDLHLKLMDLSMGGAIPDAYIGSSAPLACLRLDLGAAIIEPGVILNFISKSKPELKRAWAIYQNELEELFIRGIP